MLAPVSVLFVFRCHKLTAMGHIIEKRDNATKVCLEVHKPYFPDKKWDDFEERYTIHVDDLYVMLDRKQMCALKQLLDQYIKN